MGSSDSVTTFVFPKWTNILLPALVLGVSTGPVYLVVLAAYGASPSTTNVGYAPKQPVPYSHAIHVVI